MLFFFGQLSSEKGDGCEILDEVGGRDGCGGGCEGGLTRFGDVIRGDCIGVVVANGVRMSVGGGGSGTREGTIMRGGGGACSSSGSSGY